MRILSAILAVGAMLLSGTLLAQESIDQAPNVTPAPENQHTEPPCEPHPLCAIIGSPYLPPTGGLGGIISADRAPGFDMGPAWGQYELDPESNVIILHRDDRWEGLDRTHVVPDPNVYQLLQQSMPGT